MDAVRGAIELSLMEDFKKWLEKNDKPEFVKGYITEFQEERYDVDNWD